MGAVIKCRRCGRLVKVILDADGCRIQTEEKKKTAKKKRASRKTAGRKQTAYERYSGTTADETSSAGSRSEQKTYKAECSCGKTLKFRGIPFTTVKIRCTACGAVYEYNLFLTYIRGRRINTRNSRTANRRRRMTGKAAASVLGLKQEKISLKEIKRAYREKVKQFHPDKFASLGKAAVETAEREIKEINEAYSYLKRNYA
jgi:hypothetical protein